MQVTSPDISELLVHALYDLTSATPFVKLTNKSQGAHLDRCSLFFELYSSTGILYYSGNAGSPDAAGNFTEWSSPTMLQVQNHLEWSGPPFKILVYAIDSNSQIVGPLVIETIIRKPNGNTGGNNFGAASLREKVLCQQAVVRVEDISNYGYQGMNGVLDIKTIKLIYPADGTGAVPPPFVQDNFSIIEIPVWYSSENYQLVMDAYMLYHLADGLSSIRLKYKFNQCLPVLCNVDLCKVACEVAKFASRLHLDGCNAGQQTKLALVNAKLNQAMIGYLQPSCGIDVAGLVKEISAMIGSDCGCNTTAAVATGIVQQTSLQQMGSTPNGNCSIPQNLNGSII